MISEFLVNIYKTQNVFQVQIITIFINRQINFLKFLQFSKM